MPGKKDGARRINLEVKFKNVSMKYDESDKIILEDMSFSIKDHSLVSILGPSGCGKSTTLMLISGLLFPTDGQIFFGDINVTKKDAVQRKVGMVFQNYALYPHLSVLDNIVFPLKMARVSKKKRIAKARELAELVKITDHLHKKPGQLSGGQQQRVAIARALAKEPSILLMDEPLSNLDAKLRVEMREEIRRIQQETGVTTVFVTHDQVEALSISDKVMVLNDGVIQQNSSPQTLYADPQNIFVAQFLGSPQLNTFELENLQDKLPPPTVKLLTNKNVMLVGVRPESWVYADNETGLISGEVLRIEIIGKERTVRLQLKNGQVVDVSDVDINFNQGDIVSFNTDIANLLYFDGEGNRVVIDYAN